ncbi:unnamed protein product [Adineta steineri]|uniref:Uncharacterized protein n=1 Tax=Adineta steineri TaxID=433720 RepID=A0A813NFE2_9BILA|nr:unnamed protein product [Adineta steineri]CAF0737944.1 unnamed protein product [Adineta steineri]CAF0769214.1 unnamed protein product [Adineta steineri]
MGSRVSCNAIDDPLNNNTISSVNNSNLPQPHVYIKDKFQLEFLDCNCYCDTTKKIANCDFQDNNLLHDLYEMIVTPEYKFNCRCSCGDDNDVKKHTIKFGLTGSPNTHITCDGLNLSCPISSDSKT